jgi:hypothetical protein
MRGARQGRGEFNIPRQTLEKRAYTNRLDQPAIETLERHLPESAAFKGRKQHQAASDRRLPRGLRKPISGFRSERAIDDDDIWLVRGVQCLEAGVQALGAIYIDARFDKARFDNRRLEWRIGDDESACSTGDAAHRLRCGQRLD